jgi:hypothetical protein
MMRDSSVGEGRVLRAAAIGGLLVLATGACREDVPLGARDSGRPDSSAQLDRQRPPDGKTAADSKIATDVKGQLDRGCLPMPSCNWCGGSEVKDSKGCVVGFQCANLADPCTTQPCSQTPPTGCKATETCGSDMLCWPSPPAFACGPLTCKAGEYCYRLTPGVCGGPAPSDAGVCPAHCTLTVCPGGQPACICDSYSCSTLPAGCTSCSCLGGSGCSCTQSSAAGIEQHCYAP